MKDTTRQALQAFEQEFTELCVRFRDLRNAGEPTVEIEKEFAALERRIGRAMRVQRMAVDVLEGAHEQAEPVAAINTGHGHVFPRPDGVKMRCGGPGICLDCMADKARKDQAANVGGKS